MHHLDAMVDSGTGVGGEFLSCKCVWTGLGFGTSQDSKQGRWGDSGHLRITLGLQGSWSPRLDSLAQWVGSVNTHWECYQRLLLTVVEVLSIYGWYSTLYFYTWWPQWCCRYPLAVPEVCGSLDGGQHASTFYWFISGCNTRRWLSSLKTFMTWVQAIGRTISPQWYWPTPSMLAGAVCCRPSQPRIFSW